MPNESEYIKQFLLTGEKIGNYNDLIQSYCINNERVGIGRVWDSKRESQGE
jgi:hypothetical protein